MGYSLVHFFISERLKDTFFLARKDKIEYMLKKSCYSTVKLEIQSKKSVQKSVKLYFVVHNQIYIIVCQILFGVIFPFF